MPARSPLACLLRSQLMTWPASSATIAFANASSVTVVINGTEAGLPGPAGPLIAQEITFFPWSFFQIDVDGKPVVTGNVSDNATVWRPACADGVEAERASVWLQSISLGGNGTFLPPPPSPGMVTGRRMTFVGDSYTVGFGNIGHLGCIPNSSDENALLGYGPTTARHYQADYQVLAWSGAGVNVYPNERQALCQRRCPAPLPLVLPSAFRSGFVVVLAGGTNDFHNSTLSADNHTLNGAYGLPPVEQWVNRYAAYVRAVRDAWPQATIINLVWPFETTIYLQYMALASSRLQMEGLPGVYTLQLDGSEFQARHSILALWQAIRVGDAATDALVAAQLIQFIDAVTPSFGTATYTNAG
eukprot:scaffold6.g2726.t1